jgi:hypothetical protein
METTKSPGQVAFEAYNESKGGLTYDGKPIPPWSSLEGPVGEAVQRAWEAAAVAVQTLAYERVSEVCDLYMASVPSDDAVRAGYTNAAMGIQGRVHAMITGVPVVDADPEPEARA